MILIGRGLDLKKKHCESKAMREQSESDAKAKREQSESKNGFVNRQGKGPWSGPVQWRLCSFEGAVIHT